jgi:hypothetical protein
MAEIATASRSPPTPEARWGNGTVLEPTVIRRRAADDFHVGSVMQQD